MKIFPGYSVVRMACVFALVLSSSSVWSQNSIYLQQINNYLPGYIPNWVEANNTFTLKIGVSCGAGDAVDNIHGLFEVYSTDGATWQPIEATWSSVLNWNSLFDGFLGTAQFSANGEGADTALFNAFSISGGGLSGGTSAIAWILSTQVDASQIGKQICLDSCEDVRGITWMWSAIIDVLPSWSGPHCFTIEADCCQGIRGDINGDGKKSNILDLTFLVNRIFRGGPPASCELEADLNGDGISGNINDLTYLVDFKWRGGPAEVSCP